METTSTTPFAADPSEEGLEALAPLVREAFRRAGGPSSRVMSAICAEAERHLAEQSRRRRFIPLFRTLATAAALALLLGGAVQLHLARLETSNAREITHLLNLGASHLPPGMAEATPELAGRLLNIQGLDTETFLVTSEEPQVLWL